MKKIRAGRYQYRGYEVVCIGYHQPDHCVWWEATSIDSPGVGCLCFHGNTKREVKWRIDEYEDHILKTKKDGGEN